MYSRISRVLLLSSLLFVCALSTGTVFAQAQPNDTFTFFGVAQPQGPVTASYLRMHHPLYLFDLCRQVKAGSLDRQKVEGLVGHSVLDALLGRDLDALFQTLTAELTGPHPGTGHPPDPNSLWYQILTNGQTAPLPALDPPEPLNFRDVRARDFPSQTLRVTSPADGVLEARLPSDIPFQILSMQSYDGVILQLPPNPNRPGAQPHEGLETDTHLSPEMARTQAPWVLPVLAGQDVDVTIGLPVGAVIPAGGISSMITVGDPSQNLWHVDVPIQVNAPLPLDNDIYISITTPKHFFDLPREPAYNPNLPFTFLVPLTVSTPFPAVTVKGTVKPLSLPQGVSMSSANFILQPQGSVSLSLAVSIDRQSQAWFTENVSQPFSIRVSYQTVPAFSAQTGTVNFHFTLYPSSQSWFAKGSSGGVNCEQQLLLYSDGTLSRFGDCDNRNAYTAKVVSEGTLVFPKVIYDFYSMGWFDQDFKWSTVSVPYFQTNYVFVRSQPLLMSWTKY